MTIYVNWGEFEGEAGTLQDDMTYAVGPHTYKFDYCYASFWDRDIREKGGYIRVAANRRLKGEWLPPHIPSLVRYVQWLEDVFSLPMRVVVSDEHDLDAHKDDDRYYGKRERARLGLEDLDYTVEHTTHKMWAIEVLLTPGVESTRLYTALAYARFACYEYTQHAPELDEFTPQSLLESIFRDGKMLMSLHLPIEDHFVLFDRYGQDPAKLKLDASFGTTLYRLAETRLRTRQWRRGVKMESGIRAYEVQACMPNAVPVETEKTGVYVSESVSFYRLYAVQPVLYVKE